MKTTLPMFTRSIMLAATLSLSLAGVRAAYPQTTVPPATTPPAPPTAPAPVAPPLAAQRIQRPVLLVSGVTAPEIAATDIDGKDVKLSDFKGKVVVIDFWASWCPPCKASMPHNQEVIKKLQAAGVPVVLLAVDNSEHGADGATRHDAYAAWVKAHPEYDALKFVFVDPKASPIAHEGFHVTGIPTQYIIDAQGVVRASFVGYGGPTDDLENAVHAAAEPIKVASK